MILVDTSVWIDHLRGADQQFQKRLLEEQILVHPFVIGELACGNLKNRTKILHYLSRLPAATLARHNEVLEFIERWSVMGKGLGYVDIHLLTSAALSNASLWTRDRRLARIATKLDLGY